MYASSFRGGEGCVCTNAAFFKNGCLWANRDPRPNNGRPRRSEKILCSFCILYLISSLFKKTRRRQREKDRCVGFHKETLITEVFREVWTGRNVHLDAGHVRRDGFFDCIPRDTGVYYNIIHYIRHMYNIYYVANHIKPSRAISVDPTHTSSPRDKT